MTARWLVLGASAVAIIALGLGMSLQIQRVAVPVQPSPAPPWSAAQAGDDAVQHALRAGRPMVVEFGANACAACREMKPVLEALRREHGDRISVVNVDLIAQKHMGHLQRYRIQLMPTQVFFDAQGRETGRHMGKISADEILARLEAGAR